MIKKDLCSKCILLDIVTCPILDKAITEGDSGIHDCDMYYTLKRFGPLYIERKLGRKNIDTALQSHKNTPYIRETYTLRTIREETEDL